MDHQKFGRLPIQNYGHYIEGFFVPPIDGDYKFYVSGDDQV